MDRYPCDRYIPTDKITLNYIRQPEDQEPFLTRQLKICGVDYFDNYLLHNLGAVWYPVAERMGTFQFLQDMRDKGLVRRIGFSFHGTADVLDTILRAHLEMELVQLQINYLDWEDPNIQSRKCYEVARAHGKEIVVMEPIKGGTLINLPQEAIDLLRQADPTANLASWAIRFAASLEGILTALSGMSTAEQLEDNIGYMEQFRPLFSEEKQGAELLHARAKIACTNCRYCTTECPRQMAIPDYFGLYNNMKRLKNTGYIANQKVYYANLSKAHGKASDCIHCGLCEKNCPQRLPIRDLLQTVAAAMEGEDVQYCQVPQPPNM